MLSDGVEGELYFLHLDISRLIMDRLGVMLKRSRSIRPRLFTEPVEATLHLMLEGSFLYQKLLLYQHREEQGSMLVGLGVLEVEYFLMPSHKISSLLGLVEGNQQRIY